MVVKKTFRYSNVFFLQPLIPQFRISEHNYGKRYKIKWRWILSITLPELRAIAKIHGPVALVHFDSHTDTNDQSFQGAVLSFTIDLF